MRMWEIAVIVFAFSMSVSIGNTLVIDTGLYSLAPVHDTSTDTVTQGLNETIGNINTTAGQIASSDPDNLLYWVYSFGLFLQGFGLMVQTIGNATVFLPFLLTNFYFPPVLAWGISTIVWLIWGYTIVQYLTKTGGKGTQ